MTLSSRLEEKFMRELTPEFKMALEHPSTVEIMLNPDGNLWVETIDAGMEKVSTIDTVKATMMMSTVATSLGKVITESTPILEGELPVYGYRFSGQIPPVVDGPCFTIRKPNSKALSLDDYLCSKIASHKQISALYKAVTERKNILIVGGTGSGKTTLTNAVLNEIVCQCPDDRLIILEDTKEIECNAANKVQMRTSRSVSLMDLARANLRMRPTRIIVGEVRGGEALSLLKTWNTGHPGGIATIHANSAYSGLTRMEQLISEVSATPMQVLVGDAIDIAVFIKRTPEGRKISEIIKVSSYKGERYVTEEI